MRISSLAISQRKKFNMRGLFTGLVLIPFIILAVFSRPRVTEFSNFEPIVEVLGWVVFTVGLIFRFWSTLYLGGFKEKELIQDGPYSLCRNPLYMGTFLILLSMAIFQFSYILLVAFVLIVLAFYFLILPAEENILRDKFGQEYIEYCQKTNRLWPGLKNFSTREYIDVRTHHLFVEFKRAVIWIFMPLIFDVIAHLQAQSWFPFLF